MKTDHNLETPMKQISELSCIKYNEKALSKRIKNFNLLLFCTLSLLRKLILRKDHVKVVFLNFFQNISCCELKLNYQLLTIDGAKIWIYKRTELFKSLLARIIGSQKISINLSFKITGSVEHVNIIKEIEEIIYKFY